VMSAKLLLLVLILVAGIAGHTYKEIKGQPIITLVEEPKDDNLRR